MAKWIQKYCILWQKSTPTYTHTLTPTPAKEDFLKISNNCEMPTVLIFMLRFLCTDGVANSRHLPVEAAARENGMPENRLSVCGIVKMHDNKSNKNLFCCVCLNFHPISLSIHVIGIGERTFARTHARLSVCCIIDVHSRFRPLFISLLKYNGDTFTMLPFDMVLYLRISTFFWPPGKRISQYTRSKHFDTKSNTNKTNSTHLDLYSDT